MQAFHGQDDIIAALPLRQRPGLCLGPDAGRDGALPILEEPAGPCDYGSAGSEEFPGVNLDLLAYDIADMLGRFEYPLDVACSDIRPALPAFLRAITGSGGTG